MMKAKLEKIVATIVEAQSKHFAGIKACIAYAACFQFNAGGHYNHTLFWEILVPKEKQSGIIKAEFDAAVKAQYGSIDSLKKLINSAASSRFGSGWAWLIVTPDKKLMVTSSGNQDNPIMDVAKDRGIPILGIDVWEHAYYLVS